MSATDRPVGFLSRVLIVEDDHQLAGVLADVLIYENCHPEMAANGMEALDKLRSADYEAVICDLLMPRLDGQQLYELTVKEFPYLAEKFLFITGQAAAKAGLTNFIRRTGNSLLEKPFEIEQLRAALRELLAR